MTFVKDLEFGNNYEIISLEYIDRGEIMKGNFKPYDIIDRIGLKYEVKADKLAYKYGNICIEYQCSNKPSGITTTESDYYMYFIVNPDSSYQLYKIPTNVIRRYILEKKYKRETKGGDGWRARMYLFDKNVFCDYIINNDSPV